MRSAWGKECWGETISHRVHVRLNSHSWASECTHKEKGCTHGSPTVLTSLCRTTGAPKLPRGGFSGVVGAGAPRARGPRLGGGGGALVGFPESSRTPPRPARSSAAAPGGAPPSGTRRRRRRPRCPGGRQNYSPGPRPGAGGKFPRRAARPGEGGGRGARPSPPPPPSPAPEQRAPRPPTRPARRLPQAAPPARRAAGACSSSWLCPDVIQTWQQFDFKGGSTDLPDAGSGPGERAERPRPRSPGPSASRHPAPRLQRPGPRLPLLGRPPRGSTPPPRAPAPLRAQVAPPKFSREGPTDKSPSRNSLELRGARPARPSARRPPPAPARPAPAHAALCFLSSRALPTCSIGDVGLLLRGRHLTIAHGKGRDPRPESPEPALQSTPSSRPV